MKSEFFPLSLSKVTEPSIHFTMDSAEAIKTSIMRLLEENAALRLLAAQLNSELVLPRGQSRRFIEQYGTRCWEADVLPASVIADTLDALINDWLDVRLWQRRAAEIEAARKLL
jgi:hypothetical protein